MKEKRQKLKEKSSYLLSFFFLLFAPFAAFAQSAEEIRSFTSDITVMADGRISVTERIEYVFPSPRHGIFRDVPTRYVDENGQQWRIPVKVQSVTTETGAPWKYEVSSNSVGIRIKIGDPNVTVTGTRTYVISYSASGALRYFADHDELYWNVTGNEWTVPIRRSSATVRLPDNVPGDSLTLKCYTGPAGSTAEDCLYNRRGNTAEFVANDAMTVVVGWPPGLVAKVEAAKVWEMPPYWPIIFPILVLAYLIHRWWTTGRDPKGRGTLVVQYDPPDKITPAEMGVLIDESADLTDVSATIVDLAVRGFLKIREVETKGILFTSKDYEFELRKDFRAAPELKPHEVKVLETVFVGSAPGAVSKLSALKSSYAFNTTLPEIKKRLYGQTVALGYFAASPEAIRNGYIAAGVAVCFVGYLLAGPVLGLVPGTSILAGTVAVTAAGVLFFAFAPFMAKKTEKGTAAYDHAIGFSEYLEKAEKYRLQWQEKEKMFESFLPYAMIFGVVAQWTDAFKDIAMKPPDWYEGSAFSNGVFNTVMFGSMMRNMDASVGQAMRSAPSKSSGGSGFGGGSSGGGGGGGGGGSW